VYWGHDLPFRGSRDVIGHDHSIRHFVFVFPWNRACLQPFFEILGYKSIGALVWPLTVARRHQSRDRLAIGYFLLVVLWNQASISNVLRDIQWRMWRSVRHDLRRPPTKG